MSPKYCEDCGDEVETRRTRCPNCGKLVCGWCYYHIHGVYSMVASALLGQPNNTCSGLAVHTCIHGVYLDNQACSVCEPEPFESANR